MEYFAVTLAMEVAVGLAVALAMEVVVGLAVALAMEVALAVALAMEVAVGLAVGIGSLSTIFITIEAVGIRPGYQNISIISCLREDRKKYKYNHILQVQRLHISIIYLISFLNILTI